jgi:hypothetical protein
MSAGANTFQETDIADTTFGPGQFYIALVLSSTATVFATTGPEAEELRALGVGQQASSTSLPTTFTLAAPASAFLPVFGISTRLTI